MFLNRFRSIRPRFETSQEEALSWLAAAHKKAESASNGESRSVETYLRLLQRYGCAPPKILKRGHDSIDCKKSDWSEMEIFKLEENAKGASLKSRMEFFQRNSGVAMDLLYGDIKE